MEPNLAEQASHTGTPRDRAQTPGRHCTRSSVCSLGPRLVSYWPTRQKRQPSDEMGGSGPAALRYLDSIGLLRREMLQWPRHSESKFERTLLRSPRPTTPLFRHHCPPLISSEQLPQSVHRLLVPTPRDQHKP